MKKNNLTRYTGLAIMILSLVSIIIIPFSWMINSIRALAESLIGGVFSSALGVINAILLLVWNIIKIYFGYYGFKNADNISKYDKVKRYGIIMVAVAAFAMIRSFSISTGLSLFLSGLYVISVNNKL